MLEAMTGRFMNALRHGITRGESCSGGKGIPTRVEFSFNGLKTRSKGKLSLI